MAPEGEGYAIRSTAAQCLAPTWGQAVSDSAFVRSRLASVFLRGNPTRQITSMGRSGILCLSQEEGRWRLRRTRNPELLVD
jgi:hypothetical protein